MEKIKKFVKHPYFLLLCLVLVVFVVVIFVWQNDKNNKFKTVQQDSLLTRPDIVDETVKKDLSSNSFEKPYLGHNIDLSDSLCVFMWQKELATAIRDWSGVSDSVETIGGCMRGRVVGKLFFFKEGRFGLENLCRDSTKYFPVSVMTDNPTQTQLWREKSNPDSIYFKSLYNAVEICAGTILFPEETRRIIEDMESHGIIIPKILTAQEIKNILDQYAFIEKRAY